MPTADGTVSAASTEDRSQENLEDGLRDGKLDER